MALLTTDENTWVSYLPFTQTILNRYARMLKSVDSALDRDDILQDAYVVFRAARRYYAVDRHVPFPMYYSMLLSRSLLARYRRLKWRKEVHETVPWREALRPSIEREDPMFRILLGQIYERATRTERRLILGMLVATPASVAFARRRRMRLGSIRMIREQAGWSPERTRRAMRRLRRRFRHALEKT